MTATQTDRELLELPNPEDVVKLPDAACYVDKYGLVFTHHQMLAYARAYAASIGESK